MPSPFITPHPHDLAVLKHAIMGDIQAIDDFDDFLAVDDAEDDILALLRSGQDAVFDSFILR
jgi:hypothetical protein